ncbi:MAG: hypothetical protein ACFBSD_04440 [Paracoccaceae bacterium]
MSAFDDVWPTASWLAPTLARVFGLGLERPEATTVVVWNHHTEAMIGAPSCRGSAYFPPPPVIRLERLPGVRVFFLCTGADQRGGARAYFETRRAEILALADAFAAAGLPSERLFLAGQSGGATASALALAAEPQRFGGALLFAMAWRGRGEGKSRRFRPDPGHDAWVRTQLSKAERLPGLLVAFRADAWNGPEDLAFLVRPERDLTLFVPRCPAGHGGAFQGCAVEPVARAVRDWIAARIP